MLHDIEIRQLRALRAVHSEGSFGRAAELLGFTQSAISQQIAALERAVGDRVFDRPGGPRRVALTPIGEVVLNHANVVLDQLRTAEDELRSMRAGEVGRLVIGSFQSISVKILPEVISELRRERPGLTIRCVEEDDTDDLINQLMDGSLDLTFIEGGDVREGLDVSPLCVDQYVLLSPNTEHRTAVPVAELLGSPMIGQQECSCQLKLEASLRGHGVEPDYVFRTNDNAAVQAMVRAGMGRAILPYLCIDANDPAITVSALLPALAAREISIARPAGRTINPAAARFIELAAQISARLCQFETAA